MTTKTDSRIYDALFILPANTADSDHETLVNGIRTQLEEAGVKVFLVDELGKVDFERALHNYGERQGKYVRFNCEADAGFDSMVRNRFKLNEDVIRLLVTQSTERTPPPEPVVEEEQDQAAEPVAEATEAATEAAPESAADPVGETAPPVDEEPVADVSAESDEGGEETK